MEHSSVARVLANFQVGDVLVAVVAVVVLQYLWVVIQFSRKTRPPGPFPLWPVIGNLPLVGKLPYRSFYNLAQQYGDIMELKLGSMRTVVVSSPAMAKAVLKDHDDVFASRPANVYAEILMYGYKDIAFANGQHWRAMRKVCVLELFTPKRLESFKVWRAEEVSSFVQGIFERSKEGKPVNMQYRLTDLALNVVTRMLLKKRYFDSDRESTAEAKEFKELIVNTMVLAGVFNISDLIPYLKPFDLQGYQARMKRVRTNMDKFLDKLIEEHLKPASAGLDDAEKDFVAVMLSLPGQGSDRLDNDTIKAIIDEIICAGTDTSATTIEWSLVNLLKNPQVMKKAQDELDEVVGRERVVEEDDLPKLKYLHAIVKETFRLHPPGPLLLPRKSLAPCEIEGYHIPADTLVYVNAWAVHRHPSAYKNPLDYNPERFVGTEVDVKGQSFHLLPFGSGRRVCPGMALGITMVQFALARFLHSFNISLPAGEEPEGIDMTETFGVTVPKAIPLQVVAAARLPLHLYTAN